MLVALSGCANFPDWGLGGRDAVETPAPSDRFLLPADGSDVIGDVQVTVAHHQDTLHDIARRYDLGYEDRARIAAWAVAFALSTLDSLRRTWCIFAYNRSVRGFLSGASTNEVAWP